MSKSNRVTEIKNIPEYEGIGVYAITGSSGRKYIGSSVNVRQRIMQHAHALRCGYANRKIQKAFDDGETFTADILHKLPDGVTLGELRDLEFKEIIRHGGRDVCFNDAGTTTYHPSIMLFSPVITLELEPGTKDRWKAAADGKSLQKFIFDAVEAAIKAKGTGD